MKSGGSGRELLELARLYRIQTSYLDMTKQPRKADPEALLLVLRAIGAGVENFQNVPEALARRKNELSKRRDEPFDPSPYSPATRLFWNEFYIDLERVPEFAGSIPGERPPKTKLVDYRAVMTYKRRILEELTHRFFSEPAPRRLRAFRKFIAENKQIENYAEFRAATDRQRKGWTAWPAVQREGRLGRSDYDEKAKKYHLYAQWIIQQQLAMLADKARTRAQVLYLDLPLGLHRDSYDVWRYRKCFVPGVAGGAPPDPVFTRGQNWGFPPMNPEAMRLKRYKYVIAFLRNHLRFARLIRIDHVMGLHRLYWIPEGLSGIKGVYVEYPPDNL